MHDTFPLLDMVPERVRAAALLLCTHHTTSPIGASIASLMDAARATISSNMAAMGDPQRIATAMLSLDPATVRTLPSWCRRRSGTAAFRPALAWMAGHPGPFRHAHELCQAWHSTPGRLGDPPITAVVMATAAHGAEGVTTLVEGLMATLPVRLDAGQTLAMLASDAVVDSYRAPAFANAVVALAPFLSNADPVESARAVNNLAKRPAAILALLVAGMPTPLPIWDDRNIMLARDIHRRMSTAHGRMGMLTWWGRPHEAATLDGAQALAVLT